MADLALRLLVSLAAGAMMRMLAVFGVLPVPFALLMLGVVAAFLSKGLQAVRFLVVVSTSLSYFAAWYFTQPEAAPQALDTPDFYAVVRGGVEAFAPFVTPVVGSVIMLAIERQRRTDPVEEEITEESLLAEELPQVPDRDLYYNLTDSE